MGKFFSTGNAKIYKTVTAIVQDILDINLFKLDSGEIIRLVGVVPSKVTYKGAFDFLRDVVLGRKVTIEYDSSRRDEKGNLLGFMYLLAGKDFEAIKDIEILEKFRQNLRYLEPADECANQPEGLFEVDAYGNKGINPDIAKMMRPKGDLYLQINLALISCGFAVFKSMPPDICMDGLFKVEYNKAYENKIGIWEMGLPSPN